MNGGDFCGRSFGPRGAHYDNSRSSRRDNSRNAVRNNGDEGQRRSRSRGDNDRNHRNYSRENFDNNSESRRNGRSQNENWSNNRIFTRWDQPSSSSSVLPSSWLQNRGGLCNNGPIRFQHRNDSQQYYNRGGHGYFSSRNYRFPSLRGSQNFFSPYYSAPFRENSYHEHDREILPEEPTTPLLGSEEERQQKITEAADELKRKLLSASDANNDAEHWEDDNVVSQISNHVNEISIVEQIHQMPHELHQSNISSNNSKGGGRLNDNRRIDSIATFDYIQMDNTNELTTAIPMLDNSAGRDIIHTNLITIPTIDVNNESSELIDKQTIEMDSTVHTLDNPKQPAVQITNENFNNLATECLNLITPTGVIENPTTFYEPVRTILTNELSNIISTIANTTNNIELKNPQTHDKSEMNSSMTETSNTITNNQMTIDINVLNANKTQEMPFTNKSAVQTLPKKKELNLIEYLQEQIALSKNKSLSLSNQKDNIKTKVTSEINKKNDSFSISSNHDESNESENIDQFITTNHKYSEPNILQPPPLPPKLPPPTYESTDICLNAIVPEFDPLICSSNVSSPCGTFQQSSGFNNHLSLMSPIISATSINNSSMNISAPISNYTMSHQNYGPITHYGSGVSLSYQPTIPALDYVTVQSIPPPPPPLPQSPQIHQDIHALNINDDNDVLDELKEAMEFAKQCMVMGNDDAQTDEGNIEFPTFPDLPPMMPETAPPEKSKMRKNCKTKKTRHGIFGPHLQAIAKAKEKNMNANIETKTHIIRAVNETSDDPIRRKVAFNLNSKSRVLNISDNVWSNDQVGVDKRQFQNKWRAVPPVIREKDKSNRNDQTEKNTIPGKKNQYEKKIEWKKISKPDDKDGKNNYRKSPELNRSKKYDIQHESSSDNNITKKNHRITSLSARKPEKNTSNDIVVIDDENSKSKVKLSSSNKVQTKIVIPKSLNESSWKDRVIGRFLKMSKNDIQNMINNSSLRKFDIAMQHLIKEKKSSLSLEIRNHEGEKMKTSTYDSEDFMSQLQAILDPAATVDITNLPTNFIHQLSEVLHLDPLPVSDTSSCDNIEKAQDTVVLSNQEASTSNQIDLKVKSESPRDIVKNIPVITSLDVSKLRKIDTTLSKDTVKNTSNTVLQGTACPRSKVKRNQITNINTKRKSNEAVPLSASSPENNIEIKVNESNDNSVITSVNRSKTFKPTSNTKISNVPSVINKTHAIVNEQVATIEPTMTTAITTTTITTVTSTPTHGIETPIIACVARQSIEVDKLFTVGISKAKTISSFMKTSSVNSTCAETMSNDAQHSKILHRGITHTGISESIWRRKGIDDADVFRNMTKEEYDAQHTDPLSHKPHEDEQKKIADARVRKVPVQGHETTAYSLHADKSTSYECYTPPPVPPQYISNQIESAEAESDSHGDSDTSGTSSSSSGSEVEPSLVEVTKVLKFIKEREKMAKKKTINEEIRDEVAAEIEKRRREKNTKHKSHKSRSKKRDKRKKDKKIKKRKPKKKRRQKCHNTLHGEHNLTETNELPLRLLAEDEIKREPIDNELLKTIQNSSKISTQPRRPIAMAKVSMSTVTSALANKSINTETPIVTMPPISPASTPFTSAFKTNPMLNSPSLIVTVKNTSISNTNTSGSGAVKSSLLSTASSPLRTVTAVSAPYSTMPQSPILQQKTKAQLKQMPEAAKIIQNNNSKAIEPKIIAPQVIETRIVESKTMVPKIIEETKIIDLVSSTSESQTIKSESIIPVLLPNTLNSSTTAVTTTTQSGPRKLDIKTYHERALQRKLKEQQRMKSIEANPMQLTQNLLALPIKSKLSVVNDISNYVDIQQKTSESKTATSIVDQINNVPIDSSSIVSVTELTNKSKHIQLKTTDDISPKTIKNELNTTGLLKDSVLSTDTNLDEICTSNILTVEASDNKFINIKSEGGKELKLREKVKKRPQKNITSTGTTASVNIDIKTEKKVTPTARNRRKNSNTSIDANRNIEEASKNTDNIDVVIDTSLSSANIPITNDVKANYVDNNPSENIETDAFNIVQRDKVLETNEPLIQINDVVMAHTQLSGEVNSIKNLEQINSEQISSNQSESIKKILNVSDNEVQISTFSHYFTLTKGLISDGLPDLVAQENMTLQMNIKVPEIIHDAKTMEVDNINAITSVSKPGKEDKIIKSDEKVETDVKLTTAKVAENIASKNQELRDDSQNPDDLLEVMVKPDIVSDLLKDNIDETQSLPSASIIPDKNVHSSLSTIIKNFNSTHAAGITLDSSSTDLFNSAELSNADSTISNTYNTFQGGDKSQNYEQLTLNNLSDISMDGSALSDHKELSQASLTDTDILSETQNNVDMANLMGNDTLLTSQEKEDDKLTIIEGEMENWNDHEINEETNLISQNINKDSLALHNTEAISNDVSSTNACYKEYTEQQIVIHDQVLSIEEPHNSFLEDPITFSNIKSPTLEPIDFGILDNNDIMAEPMYDSQQFGELSTDNTLVKIVTSPSIKLNNEINDNGEIAKNFAQSTSDNSCQLPPPAQSTSLSNDSITHNSPIHHLSLVKIVENALPKRVPSTIFQIASALLKNNENTKNAVTNKMTKVKETENLNCQLHNKRTNNSVMNANFIAAKHSSSFVDNSSARESNANQEVIESPTSTTRIIERNSPECDESERSSSETRSIEPDRSQSESTFNPITSEKKSHHRKRNKDNDSFGKVSRSKSCMLTMEHKNRKHDHSQIKHKLTLEHVEEAIAANIANLVPHPTTKDAVMLRMQEIDIAIQRLMNEKMTLYQMLQTDQWPVNQNDETINKTSKSKSKSQLSIEKLDQSSGVKEPRIIMSRLTDSSNVKCSTIIEASTTKSQMSNTLKNDSLKNYKSATKNNEKRSKKLDEDSSKIRKRKYSYNHKGSGRSIEIRKDGSPLPMKCLSISESSRPKNKSPLRVKNTEGCHHKVIKLSQMLAREFKPKVNVAKHRPETPTSDNENSSSDVHLENEEKNICNATPKMIKPSSLSRESSDEENSGDFIYPMNASPHDDHNLNYSNENNWSTVEHSGNKFNRTTGLSLLERSIKHEISTKKVKISELRRKLPPKPSQNISSSINTNTDTNLSHTSISKIAQQRKKYHTNTANRILTKSTNHVREVIDAVAKNQVNTNLYTANKSVEKKQKLLQRKDNHSKIDKSGTEVENLTKSKEEILIGKTKNQSDNGTKNNPDENKQSAVDSSSDENENHKLIICDGTLAKNKVKIGKIKKSSIANTNKEVNKSQSCSSVFISQEDVQLNHKHTEIVSSTPDDDVRNEKCNGKLHTAQKMILGDWENSPSVFDQESNRSCNENKNSQSVTTEKSDLQIIGLAKESTILSSNSMNKDNMLPATEKIVVVDSMAMPSKKKQAESINLKGQMLFNSSISKETSIEDLVNERNFMKEHDDKSKKTKQEKEIERAKSVLNDLDGDISSVEELNRPKLIVKELDRERSKINDHDKSNEGSKSTTKELDKPKSAMRELEKSKVTMKEHERSKLTVKDLVNVESSDGNEDDNNDEYANKKRGRSSKSKKQTSTYRGLKQSDDNIKVTSRNRSHSKWTNKSPSSRDTLTPDMEPRSRLISESFSNSNNLKKKLSATSSADTKIIDKTSLVRRGRKRKHLAERTLKEMESCKVRLVDCRNLFLRSDLRSDILQRLGISKINWIPLIRQKPITQQPMNSSIIVDEDKNCSDDESIEVIQVDGGLDIQSITSPECNENIVVLDPLSISPQTSPGCHLSMIDDNSPVVVSIENQNPVKENVAVSSDEIELLESRTSTPVVNPSAFDKIDNSESQTMQYTVHKGPILDIKVFGDSFLAASEDGAIYRYCQRSNGILNIYKGHDAAVTCLYVHEVPGTADSGNTRWNLFSGSLDATLRCYDIMNGSLDRHVADVGSPIQCMDQAWGMIFVGTKSGHISRYDIKSGCLREDNLDFSDKPVLALRTSTEGVRRVLIVASRNQPITIRDAQNGLYLRTISGQRTHTVYSLMRERHLVYCGTSSTSIPVFDFVTGEQVIQYTAGDTKLICSIPGPGNMLLSMEIVNDKIIAGSKDRRLYAWKMPKVVRTILGERA